MELLHQIQGISRRFAPAVIVIVARRKRAARIFAVAAGLGSGLLAAGCSDSTGPGGVQVAAFEARGSVQVPPGPEFYPRAVFTPLPFDSLGGFHYHYLDGWLAGSILHLQVGFSGCQPEHPFTLYWQPGPEASPLPFAHLYLVHELQEDCLAYFERQLGFDLYPVWVGMGSPQVPINLRLEDFQGVVHPFELLPPLTGVP